MIAVILATHVASLATGQVIGFCDSQHKFWGCSSCGANGEGAGCAKTNQCCNAGNNCAGCGPESDCRGGVVLFNRCGGGNCNPEDGPSGACLSDTDPTKTGVCDAISPNPDGGLPSSLQTACVGDVPDDDDQHPDPTPPDPKTPQNPPNPDPGGKDPNHPKTPGDDAVCKVGGPGSDGDPFLINGGGSFHNVVDAKLKSSLGDFEFTRHYVARDAVWGNRAALGGSLDAGVPAPFGLSPVFSGTGPVSLRWWHNLYSFVYPEGFSAGSSRWNVRLPSGDDITFVACSPVGGECFGALDASSREARHQLHWSSTSNVFTLFLPNGKRYRYAAVWQPAGAQPRYFLSRIDDAQSISTSTQRTLIEVTYAAPDAGSCPFQGSGGVPYVATATNAEGTQLRFHYRALEAGASALTPTECVLSRVSLGHSSASGDEIVAQYTYSNADGGQRAGLLKTAWRPGGSDAGYLFEQYDYDYTKGRSGLGSWAGAFRLKNKFGQTLLKHDYYGGAVKLETGLSGAPQYTVGSLSACLLATGNYNRCVQAGAAGQTYSTFLFVDAGFARGQRASTRGTQGYQTNPSSLGPGVETWTWTDLSGSTAVNLAHQEKVYPDGGGGAWNGRSVQVTSALSGSPLQTLPYEVTSSFVGATSSTGTSALETTTHAYEYGGVGQSPRGYPQLKARDERASVLSSGQTSKTYYVNDTGTNRLKAVIKRGYTQVFNESTGAFSTQERFIGTFYFTSRVCSGGSADPLGRTLESHGPCWVANENATDCDMSQQSQVPVTQYVYFASGSGADSHRLNVVRHFVSATPSSCTGTSLSTTYASYDNRGNPTQVTDPNGVVTNYVYEEERVKLETVQSPDGGVTREFLWDDGVLFAVRNPEGDFDVTCYRQGGSGGVQACQPGTSSVRRPFPTYKAKMANPTVSALFSEAISYTYTSGQYLSEERYMGSSGSVTAPILTHTNDLRGNKVSRQLGTSNTYYERRVFDGSGELAGLGLNHQVIAAFCGGLANDGRPSSSLCAAFSYDRAHRLTSMDMLRDLPAQASRTCFEHDEHGNVKSIQTGCDVNSGNTCSGCSQPLAQYQHDDFGNLVAVTLPWTSNGSGGAGVTRYAFDSRGAPVHEQTPSMRATSVKDFLRTSYDAMGRKLKTESVHDNAGTPVTDTLHSLAYDDVATPHASCPQPTFTKGRLLRQTDSFGETWFQYDFAGRVLSEVRLRTGVSSCSGASPNDVPHTSYTYTRNGNLSTVTYPYGRKFTFTYGFFGSPYTTITNGQIRSVSVMKWNGSAWTADAAWQNVISNIEWWPYGGLRGYQLKHPVSGTNSGVEYRHGAAETAQAGNDCAVPGGSDYSGRMRALYVSNLSGSWAPGTGTGDILRRVLTWNGDMPVEARSCLLGVTTARRESYAYDSSGRLTSLTRPAGNWAATGGPQDSRAWTFDKRGNRLTEVADGVTFTLAYDGGLVDQATKRTSGASGSNLEHKLDYDVDGRVWAKRWPYLHVTGLPGTVYSHFMTSALTNGVSQGGLDSVYRSFTNWSTTYEYYFDANNRRRLKEYPTGARDEQFYSQGSSQMLIDRGNDSVASPTYYPVDEYLWLGGRPVMVIRGRLETSYARAADGTASCGRNGGAEKCGMYFPVTDELGRVVLMLDDSRKVAGAGEYDVYGNVNTVTVSAETAHPYANSLNQRLMNMSQPNLGGDGGVQLDVSMRAHVFWLHSENGGAGATDYLELVNSTNDGGMSPLYAGISAPFWTNWVQPDAGTGVDARFLSTSGSCCQTTAGWSCGSPFPCACAPNCPLTGVTLDSWEYKKSQTGASPFWVPLRLPGQYFDDESGLFENHNRFYAADLGRYLQPEPMLQSASFTANEARGGYATPTYSYAGSNPVAFVDPNGLWITANVNLGPDQFGPGACGPLEGGCTRLQMFPMTVTSSCHQNSAVSCQAAEGGNWSFDVSVDFDLWLGFRDTSTPNQQSYGNRFGPRQTVRQHEEGHRSDYQSGIDRVNSEFQTEGFRSQGECMAAQSALQAGLINYVIKLKAQSDAARH